jgi:hypothetical protein
VASGFFFSCQMKSSLLRLLVSFASHSDFHVTVSVATSKPSGYPCVEFAERIYTEIGKLVSVHLFNPLG